MHAVCPETSTYASTCSTSVAVGWHCIGHRAKRDQAKPDRGVAVNLTVPSPTAVPPFHPRFPAAITYVQHPTTKVRVLAIYLYASTTWGTLYINTLGPHGSVRARRVSRDATSARAAGVIKSISDVTGLEARLHRNAVL